MQESYKTNRGAMLFFIFLISIHSAVAQDLFTQDYNNYLTRSLGDLYYCQVSNGCGGSGSRWLIDGIWLQNVSNTLTFNETRLNTTIDARSGGGGGGGNPFNQSLNTTDRPIFNTLNVSSNLTAGQYNAIDSTLGYSLTDSGSDDLIMQSNVEGANYWEISTDGSFMNIYANPNPSNDYEMFAFTETQGADTDIVFYEGGTTHNRIWSSGSVRIGGGRSSLCTNITEVIPCTTTSYGADLVVEGGIFVGRALHLGNRTHSLITLNSSNGNADFLGKVTSLDWTNVSITESQISDLTHTVDTNYSNQIWIHNSSLADLQSQIDNLPVINPFNQSLNTTDSPIFNNLNVSDSFIATDQVKTSGNYSITDGSEEFQIYFDGSSNIVMKFT